MTAKVIPFPRRDTNTTSLKEAISEASNNLERCAGYLHKNPDKVASYLQELSIWLKGVSHGL